MPASHQGVLARYPLVCFFVMAYVFSWIVWSPWVLGEDGAKVLPPGLSVPTSAARLLLAAGILAGPSLSAFIMTAKT
jgi:CAAX protease family protein